VRTLDRSQGGLGVGLAVVEALVALHDGHVQAMSDGAGRGAEFRVGLAVHQRGEAGRCPASVEQVIARRRASACS